MNLNILFVNAPDGQWLDREDAYRWLDISDDLFDHYVATGVFPRGRKVGFLSQDDIDEGAEEEDLIRWSRTDVAWMLYRLENYERFSHQPPAPPPTDE